MFDHLLRTRIDKKNKQKKKNKNKVKVLESVSFFEFVNETNK